MNVGIYKITSPLGKVYIGQSRNLSKRLKGYKTISSTIQNQKRLHQSFLSYGQLSHEVKVIEYCEIDQLNERERVWQEFYDCTGSNGLNCMLVSYKNKQAVYSKESRERMSLNRMGPKNHMYGRKGKDNPTFGTKQSEETKKKYATRKGIKKSEIHKQRIGLKQIGGGNHQAKIVIDLQTGIYYGSVIEAAIAKGINRYTLSDYVNNRRGIKNKSSIILV